MLEKKAEFFEKNLLVKTWLSIQQLTLAFFGYSGLLSIHQHCRKKGWKWSENQFLSQLFRPLQPAPRQNLSVALAKLIFLEKLRLAAFCASSFSYFYALRQFRNVPQQNLLYQCFFCFMFGSFFLTTFKLLGILVSCLSVLPLQNSNCYLKA